MNFKLSIFLIALLFFMSHTVIFAQKDTATIETKEIDVSGTISVTDEGISTVPAISLGKPA